MVITMAKLRMAHASTHGARKPPGPICRYTSWVWVLGLSKPIIQPTQLGFGLSLAGMWQYCLLPACNVILQKRHNHYSLTFPPLLFVMYSKHPYLLCGNNTFVPHAFNSVNGTETTSGPDSLPATSDAM